MSPSTKNKKIVKAYGIMIANGYIKNWYGDPFSGVAIIRSKKEANEYVNNEGGQVIPVEIHYQLKGKKK